MAKPKLYDMTKDDDLGDDENQTVDLNSKDEDGLDIEIEDDTPEVDRNRPPRQGPSAIPGDDEIGAYTQGVQDRIRKMRREYHDERRAKEEALRETDRAIEFAKRLLKEREQMAKALEEGHTVLKETSTKAAESEISTYRSALSQAIAAGDNEQIALLNEKLARATARAEAATHMAPLKIEPVAVPERRAAAPQVQLSATAQEWMDKNPWFQTDDRMTAIAMAAHDRLLKSGVRAESAAYWKGIDDEVRAVFPDKFKDENSGGQPARKSPVAATMRSAPTAGRGKVVLTASEARMAEKLGVPLKDYAAQKLRMEQEANG